ncbi:MAG: AAA family ATPase [Anaerolineae bacterium]
MAVITISRELGSEGDKVADLLCEGLGYCRVDKDLLMQIAEEAGIDVEAVQELESSFTKRARLVSGEMTSLYRKQASAFDRPGAIDDRTYAEVLVETVNEFASTGDAVIVGRGGQMILQDWDNTIHVRLYAPLEVRASRIAQREGIDEARALHMVKQSDEQKRQYIRHMHNNADWRNLKYYHLAIDTSRIPPEAAAEMILLAARAVDGR